MDESLVPVLFLIFNRPDNTRRVFEAIRQNKPKYLYIAADGPRHGNSEDEGLCEQTRRIAMQVDWPCEVKTLFSEENAGCKSAVSGGISWFFSQVEEGIILEDDCLPDVTFFKFCAELLETYRDDTRVMSISGSNLLGRPWKSEDQSYFWGHGGIWGWATWRRAWNLYDITMRDWPKAETKAKIREAIKTGDWYNTYYGMFESAFNGTLDTWDIQWFYTILINNGLTINPSVNLVKNIGFGDGTHTNSAENFVAGLDSAAIEFPLKHPQNRLTDVDYLEKMYHETTGSKPKSSIFERALSTFRGKLNYRQTK